MWAENEKSTSWHLFDYIFYRDNSQSFLSTRRVQEVSSNDARTRRQQFKHPRLHGQEEVTYGYNLVQSQR